MKAASFLTTMIREEPVDLHPLRAAFLRAHSVLLCSDVHIGKAGHFRRNGLAVPAMVNRNNFWNLVEVIEAFRPGKVVFLGDLMHSESNEEWNDFLDFLAQFPEMEWTLVRGNHDRYPDQWYQDAGISVADRLVVGPFELVHDTGEHDPGDLYRISGHIHPAVRLHGAARQSLRLPCFWFGEKEGVMPAFGSFTGTAIVRPAAADKVFVIAEEKLIELPRTSVRG